MCLHNVNTTVRTRRLDVRNEWITADVMRGGSRACFYSIAILLFNPLILHYSGAFRRGCIYRYSTSDRLWLKMLLAETILPEILNLEFINVGKFYKT
jgi:hypothetical protein